MSLNSRKVCRCYPWNTEYLTESSRLSSWLRFLNVSGRSAQTLVLISLIICPAQFMLPHYNLNMTHPTQCHYSTPTPPYLIYLLRTIERIVPCHRECPDPSSRAFSDVGLWHSLAGIAGSNPAWGMDVFSLVSVVCRQVEVFASG